MLVTGGAGFIGSHLAERLIDRGDQVVVLDDLSTGSLDNLGQVIGEPGFRFVEGSVLQPDLLDELVEGADTIVHLAAAVGVKLVMDQPLTSFTTNVRGTELVIEAADRYGVKLMLASTSEVYGKNRNGVFSEDADFVYGPTSVTRWSYALSKATDEILAYFYYKERGLPTVIFRLFNTVGPRQSAEYGMVLPRLARQAISGEPLSVYGDGLQSRCFCHVFDTVRGILALMDEPGAIGGTFNIGSTSEISIIDAARQIIAKASSQSSIQLVTYAQAYGAGFEDIPRRVPDISRINALTGWKPTKSLDEILDAVISDVKAELVV
ncbi:MAG TPA: NAD-dependent epimerase/dehydratase family protein [Acidimicrobiales bacterium]|nr:NAD-dependent epimerase/dehydratase family protein [Acidimicrobiales bacterium]